MTLREGNLGLSFRRVGIWGRDVTTQGNEAWLMMYSVAEGPSVSYRETVYSDCDIHARSREHVSRVGTIQEIRAASDLLSAIQVCSGTRDRLHASAPLLPPLDRSERYQLQSWPFAFEHHHTSTTGISQTSWSPNHRVGIPGICMKDGASLRRDVSSGKWKEESMMVPVSSNI